MLLLLICVYFQAPSEPKPLSAAKMCGDNQPPAVSLKLAMHLAQKGTTERSPANSSDQQQQKKVKWKEKKIVQCSFWLLQPSSFLFK